MKLPWLCGALLAAAGAAGADLRARAEEVLRASLESRDSSLLGAAVGYAPRLRTDWATAALRRTTRHPDPTLRIAALFALVERDPASGVAALRRAAADPREDAVVRTAAADKLPGVDPEAGPLLRRLLGEGDPTLRVLAAGGLVELGDPAGLPLLEAALAGDDPDLRVDAASELLDGGLREAAALEVLSEILLGSGETIARTNAAYALGETDRPEALPLLVRALEDGDRGVRIAVASSLGLTGPRSTAVLLVVAARDPDTAVRLEAIHGLVDRASPEVARVLRRGLTDSAPVVRLAAATGLGGEEAIGVVMKEVESADYSGRLAAISALGKVGDATAAQVLAPRFDDPDPMTRLAAAIAVHRILGRGRAAGDASRPARPGREPPR